MGLQIKLKAHGKKVCRINIKYTRDKSVLNMNRHRTYGWVSETTQVLPTLHLFGSFFLSFCLSLHVIIRFMIFASTRKYVSYFAGRRGICRKHNTQFFSMSKRFWLRRFSLQRVWICGANVSSVYSFVSSVRQISPRTLVNLSRSCVFMKNVCDLSSPSIVNSR